MCRPLRLACPGPKPANRLTACPRLWKLGTLGVLPARAIDSLAQMQAVFADVPVLLLDATERPHHRPRAVVDRTADYAGKKKTDP